MFAVNLTIFVTLFLLTKQEQYWKYFSPDEFSTKNTSTSLDLKTFTKYEQLNEFNTNLHCVTVYESGLIQIMGQKQKCSSNKTFTTNHVDMRINNRSCPLQGQVRNVEFLTNDDEGDDLIFISLDGCYIEDGEVTLIMTNNVETDYETMKSNHFWQEISFGNIISCNILCTNVVLERKIVNFIHEISSIDKEEYWNFLTFEEFRTRDISGKLNMNKFKKYEHFIKPKTRLNCLLGYGDEKFNLIDRSQCCNNGLSNKKKKPGSPIICPLKGEVETVQFLRNRDEADSLIFISVEGCYTVDEFGMKSPGTVLMTNNVTTSFETYKSDYIWTEIAFRGIKNCTLLCSNIALDRCFANTTKTRLVSPLIITQTLRYAVLKFEEEKIDFVYMKIIMICFSIIFITIFLSILIFKLISAKKNEDNEKF